MTSRQSIIHVLEKTVSSEPGVIQAAQKELDGFVAHTSLGEYLQTLSAVLGDWQTCSTVARQAAGLQLKLLLTSKDNKIKNEYQIRWASLSISTRNCIKDSLLKSLGTELNHPSCVAQCLAYIVAAELNPQVLASTSTTPQLLVSDLLNSLNDMLELSKNTEAVREASIETMGLICQEADSNALVEFSSEMLMTIVMCLQKNEPSTRVRMAAANALLNSLEIAWQGEFSDEDQVIRIMQGVCDATQSKVVEEAVIALQTLVKLASYYYDYLLHFMDAIAEITLNAMHSKICAIAQQGLEFWCTISEIEYDLASGKYDPSDIIPVIRHFSKTNLPKLLPALFNVVVWWQLSSSDDIEDFDDWSPYKAAILCITFLSKSCSDSIPSYILPLITPKLKSTDWRRHVASALFLNALLEGLDKEKMEEILKPLLASIWDLACRHRSSRVRYASFLLLCRVFKTVPSLVPLETLHISVSGILRRLKDKEPRVAAVACKTLAFLVSAVVNPVHGYKIKELEGFSFTKIYTNISSHLTSYSVDKINFSHLNSTAQSALASVLRNAPNDCYNVVKKRIKELIGKFNESLLKTDESDREMQSLLLKTLPEVLLLLKPSDVDIQHNFLNSLLDLVSRESHSDNIEVIAAIADTTRILGSRLNQHLGLLIPYLKAGINRPTDEETLTLNISTINEVFCAIGLESARYLKDFIEPLLVVMEKDDLDLKIRAASLTLLYNMLSNAGPENFQPYLNSLYCHLERFSTMMMDKEKTAQWEQAHISDTHDVIMGAYSEAFGYAFLEYQNCLENQSSSGSSNRQSLLYDCLNSVANFVVNLASDPNASDEFLVTAGSLVGVVIRGMGRESIKYLDSEACIFVLDAAVSRTTRNENASQCTSALNALRSYCSV